MTLPTCSAFSLAERTSSVSCPTCLLAFLNCLPALPTCLTSPSMPLPVPGTFTPSTFLGLRANLLPSTTPPTRPATAPAPASIVFAAPESELPFDDPDALPFFDAAPALDDLDDLDAPLFARVLALDPFLLRVVVDRAPAPL